MSTLSLSISATSKLFVLNFPFKTRWPFKLSFSIVTASEAIFSVVIAPSGTLGDFWSELYFNAWIEVACQHPDIKFYAYTKQLQYWLNALDRIPSNFFLTASVGGNLDPLLSKYAHVFKRIAYVVYTEQEAADLGLEIDHDDSHCFGDKPFALLVHGVQRKGSEAQAALNNRKRQGSWTGYSK